VQQVNCLRSELTTVKENWDNRMAAVKDFADRKYADILASTTKSLQEQLSTAWRQREAQLTEQFAAYHQMTLTSTSQILKVNMEARISSLVRSAWRYPCSRTGKRWLPLPKGMMPLWWTR
jgi:hypothetical protein